MKKFVLMIASLSLIIGFLSINACKKESNSNPIKGSPGNPRFNLQFTNEKNVDLDLHVITPDSTEIFYANPSGQGGTLDVDCFCLACPSGPNENIFWTAGTAPSGTYKFWVEYFDNCATAGTSDFTLRLMNNSNIVQTYKGTLSTAGEKSQIYTFTY